MTQHKQQQVMKWFLSNLISVCFVAILPGTTVAQDTSPAVLALPSESDISSDQWDERLAAFTRLLGVDIEQYTAGRIVHVSNVLKTLLETDEDAVADIRKSRIIQLLEIENDIVERKREQRMNSSNFQLPAEEQLSEEYLNYYGDVIAAVSSVDDVRAIQSLVGAIATGNMAVSALVGFGTPAVEPVTRLLKHPDNRVRSAAVLTLNRMLVTSSGVSNDEATMVIIRNAIITASTDEYPFVRIRAIDGLMQLGDQEAIALIEQIAQSDSYRAEYRPDMPYLVREAAMEALRNLDPR